ncbi:MAG: hypothetical protein ABF504_01385, partial [Komagataeibacter saccharivorans]|uniref:hypothetical protein n=1 Tax=Komagataeibacter saccharivorans TaxID=265959 RepID=UPI0039E8BD22
FKHGATSGGKLVKLAFQAFRHQFFIRNVKKTQPEYIVLAWMRLVIAVGGPRRAGNDRYGKDKIDCPDQHASAVTRNDGNTSHPTISFRLHTGILLYHVQRIADCRASQATSTQTCHRTGQIGYFLKIPAKNTNGLQEYVMNDGPAPTGWLPYGYGHGMGTFYGLQEQQAAYDRTI